MSDAFSHPRDICHIAPGSGVVLRECEERFRVAFEHAAIGMVITDIESRITQANRAFSVMLGYSEAELVGKAIRDITYTEDLELSLNHDKDLAFGVRDFYHLDKRYINKDGVPLWVHLSVSAVRNPEGMPLYYLYQVQDISEQIETKEKLLYNSYHDSLTGLPNRMLFNDRLSLALAHVHRFQQGLAVLFLDLDDFRKVNDTLGHNAGDQVLKYISRTLETLVKEDDTVARFAGDVFTLILSEIADVTHVARVVQRIFDGLRRSWSVNGQYIYVSASIGVALYPADGSDAETLVKNADAAMHKAKELGSDTYQFYSHEMNAKAETRLTLENDLRRAIDNMEFIVHYQPRIEIASGKITSVEALVRWNHPDKGLVMPGDFISVAEDTGLIVPLGEHILRSACIQAKKWQEMGLGPIRTAVNLSARQFLDPNLLDMIESILDETGLDPDYLEFEITESTAMRDEELTRSILSSLRDQRIFMSMDDFGTGYSSMAYLKRFTFNSLKIAQTFLTDVPANLADNAIAAAIVNLAHNLGLKVVAEGVETAEQLAFLDTLFCDEIQGYYFSRPIPADRMTERLISGVFIPDGVM